MRRFASFLPRLNMKTATALVLFVGTMLPLVGRPATIHYVSFPGAQGDELVGVLYQPEAQVLSAGLLPAVVLMHPCGGMWGNSQPFSVNQDGSPDLKDGIEKWALRLAAANFVVLAVDSFTGRQPPLVHPVQWQNHCAGSPHVNAVSADSVRVDDARAAWYYLVANGLADAARIGLMGWSHGAVATLVESAVSGQHENRPRPAGDHLFAVSVAFYPWCDQRLGFGDVDHGFYRPYRDQMLLVGTNDPFFAQCAKRAATLSVDTPEQRRGHGFSLHAYRMAGHGFDDASRIWPTTGCNPQQATGDGCAMAAADRDAMAFLLTRLASPAGATAAGEWIRSKRQ